MSTADTDLRQSLVAAFCEGDGERFARCGAHRDVDRDLAQTRIAEPPPRDDADRNVETGLGAEPNDVGLGDGRLRCEWDSCLCRRSDAGSTWCQSVNQSVPVVVREPSCGYERQETYQPALRVAPVSSCRPWSRTGAGRRRARGRIPITGGARGRIPITGAARGRTPTTGAARGCRAPEAVVPRLRRLFSVPVSIFERHVPAHSAVGRCSFSQRRGIRCRLLTG